MKWQGRSQRAERERDDDREEVERDEPGRVPPDHERGEEQERRDHPAPLACEANASPPAQRDENGDEGGEPEEEVEAERHRAEQLVTEKPQEESRPE